LHRLLEDSARRNPDRIAVVEPGHSSISYGELNRLADAIHASLRRNGVGKGDRVGIHLRKSIATLACIFGILKAEAAYVPVDAGAPAGRNRQIFTDCNVRLVISEKPAGTGFQTPESTLDTLADADGLLSSIFVVPGPGAPAGPGTVAPADLAYILYTSGSTGRPKGVMLTHSNALSFIDWCSATFCPDENDCFSSHAPFHFDLSILDIYLSIKHGARLVLIAEDVGRQPKQLAALIADERISIWYSTPTILRLLLDVKEIHEYDYSSLRTVLFAGEVFPTKHLRVLQDLWPDRRYYNLYGPTETNVCTFYELPATLPPNRTEPVPIGVVCSGDTAKIMDEHDQEVPQGAEGELYVTGPSVTQGYWNLPERNKVAFFQDSAGLRWYKTGDIVKQDDDGNYIYVSRRDRMVKRRGYRVELGEIEAALYRHKSITEAAVIALPDQESGVHIRAFVNWSDDKPPSVIKLKHHCVENLPAYMIPDTFSFLASLPKTSTDKIDYQRLKEID
jgi:amino acid adenylation domain-containing protein